MKLVWDILEFPNPDGITDDDVIMIRRVAKYKNRSEVMAKLACRRNAVPDLLKKLNKLYNKKSA